MPLTYKIGVLANGIGTGWQELYIHNVLSTINVANLNTVFNHEPFDTTYYVWNKNSGTGNNNTSGSFALALDPTQIFLNGSSTPSPLPAGFNIATAQFTGGMGAPNGHYTWNVGGSIVTDNDNVPYLTIPPLTLNNVLNTAINCSWTSDPTLGAVTCYLQYTQGNYNILRWQWKLSNLTRPSAPANTFFPGDVVQVSDPTGLGGLNQITQINVGGFATINQPFCSQTTQAVTFVIPCPDGTTPFLCNQSLGALNPCLASSFKIYCCTPGLPPITPNIPVTAVAPTLYTGDVVLGSITILTQNFHGIYSVIPGQTHDVMLTGSGNTQISVPIQIPFFKTGFIGG